MIIEINGSIFSRLSISSYFIFKLKNILINIYFCLVFIFYSYYYLKTYYFLTGK